MRKGQVVAIITLLGVIAAAPAFAITHSFSVNPFGFTTPGTLSGKAEYIFTLSGLNPGESFQGVLLDFSTSPIVTSYSVSSFNYNPQSLTPHTLSNGLYFDKGGANIASTFSFSVILDIALAQDAADPTPINGLNPWHSHSAWSGNYVVFHLPAPLLPPGMSFSSSAGSVGLTPEPGSMILLGTGLLGMGLVKRYRQRRNARS